MIKYINLMLNWLIWNRGSPERKFIRTEWLSIWLRGRWRGLNIKEIWVKWFRQGGIDHQRLFCLTRIMIKAKTFGVLDVFWQKWYSVQQKNLYKTQCFSQITVIYSKAIHATHFLLIKKKKMKQAKNQRNHHPILCHKTTKLSKYVKLLKFIRLKTSVSLQAI